MFSCDREPGAALGLGFLSDYEGLFLTKLLPLFAAIALVANILGWLGQRQPEKVL